MPRQSTFPFGQPVVWEPDPTVAAATNLQRFMDFHGIASYDDLMRRSTDDVSWFWDAVIRDLDIRFATPYEQIVDLSGGIERPTWCVGGQMNIVQNCLDKWQIGEERERVALRWENEDGAVECLSYAELHARVCRCANALRSLGLGREDVVGLYMPMTPELCVAFLAVAKIGGIALPLFSGYGVEALSTRLRDAGAVALITADGFRRRGRLVKMKSVADEALSQLPAVRSMLVHRNAHAPDVPWAKERDHWWHDLVDDQPDDAATEITSAEDPLMILYTSGTTGRPKGAVHTHCGFPIKAAQDMHQCMDLRPGDAMYWMTDMGWMMGPWLVLGTLLTGAAMVFYDGAPDHPGPERVWQLVDDHEVTHLGVSPSFVRALKRHGDEPLRAHDRTGLRAVGATGGPWDPDSWYWLFEKALDGEKPILNYSGGTEISGGILCGNFLRPLKACSFSGPVPGMAADVVDATGKPLRGEVGELILRKPWIGMTRGFWNDEERYLDTYWRRLEGVWVHGDFAALDEDGLWYVLGRSDDTINVAGKRLGPAEVEAVLNGHTAVAESAAVGVPDEVKGQALVAFVVLGSSHTPSESLRDELTSRIAGALGKPLSPREIKFVSTLPKTRNAKLMRRIIRSAYLGEEAGDLSSLEDPAAVEAIRAAG